MRITGGIRATLRSDAGCGFFLSFAFNPNRSLDRLAVCLTVFLRLSKPFVLPLASCLPLCPVVARYAFGKSGSQSARQQNEIALDSNGRLGFKSTGILSAALSRRSPLRLRQRWRPISTVAERYRFGQQSGRSCGPMLGRGMPSRRCRYAVAVRSLPYVCATEVRASSLPFPRFVGRCMCCVSGLCGISG